MRGDRDLEALAAGREPVGTRQHGDLDLNGGAPLEVGVDRGCRQRPLAHEAEHQMVAGERPHERAQALARAQAAEDLRHHFLAGEVVPDEGHLAVGPDATRVGLCHVVEERSQAQRLQASQLVRQRLLEERPQRWAELAEELVEASSSSIWRRSTSRVCSYTSRW